MQSSSSHIRTPSTGHTSPHVATQAWIAYQKSDGESERPWDLAEHYLPLVKSIVSRMKVYFPSHTPVEDIYSVGVNGLISAIKNFDPSKGKSFGNYAALRIRGGIFDELRRMDRLPRSSRAIAKKYQAALAKIEQMMGRPPTEEEVRQEMGMSQEDFLFLLEKIQPISIVSLDQSSTSEESENTSIHDVISDSTEQDAREKFQDKEMVDILRQHLDKLPEINRKVLALYYYEGLRLSEIAEVFGLSESRICQIHSQAVLRLRASIARVRDK